MELAERLRAAELEEHAVTLMRAYHTAMWEELGEEEVARRRAAYMAFIREAGRDPLGEA